MTTHRDVAYIRLGGDLKMNPVCGGPMMIQMGGTGPKAQMKMADVVEW